MTMLSIAFTVLGSLILLRSALLLFFAEMGRKQDLIKHIYKSGTDFHIAIVIPFTDSRKALAFQDLMQALEKQDYPVSRLGIHIVTTEANQYGLPMPGELPSHAKVWTYPQRPANRGQLVCWLVERLLAAGGPSKLFVFLEPDDIIRPDFLKNVTTRAFDCFAIQGYLALKRPPKGPISQIVALSNRLINRIENAGRFHMGLSCRLMSSGWVVRQEVLEMLPFRQVDELDNLEYTALLNLNGYRVHWAPNVVVYKEDRVTFPSQMHRIAQSIPTRLGMLVQYVPKLLWQGISKLELNALEQAWCIAKPPGFVLGLIAATVAVSFMQDPNGLAGFYAFGAFTLAFWSLQLMSLAVARCGLGDILFSIAVTPLVYALGLVALPFYLVRVGIESVMNLSTQNRQARIGKRFDESQPAAKTDMSVKEKPARQEKSKKSNRKPRRFAVDFDTTLESPTADMYAADYVMEDKPVATSQWVTTTELAEDPFTQIYQDQLNRQEAPLQEASKEPTSVTTTLPITNGKNAVMCSITTVTDYDSNGDPAYHLIFEYKNLSFTTRTYSILDDAFEALQDKLRAKGFTLVSCGSCSNFYHPQPGQELFAPGVGYCLYGKLGSAINPNTDTVSAVTESCDSYTTTPSRSSIVKDWATSVDQRPLSSRF